MSSVGLNRTGQLIRKTVAKLSVHFLPKACDAMILTLLTAAALR